MNKRFDYREKHWVTLFIAATLAFVALNTQAAKKEVAKIREASVYIIKDGDFIGSIAIAHGVSIADLVEANGLDNPDKIYSGMELLIPGAVPRSHNAKETIRKAKPKKVFVEVPKGFTLSRIAKLYGISIARIVRANKSLSNPNNLRAGMKLLIPGATEEIELVPPPPCFKEAIEFYRVRSDETEKIHLTYCNGKANPAGVQKLSIFSSPKNLKKMPFPLHPRLALLLQKVSEKFPNRRIEVISGQRVKKSRNHESFHNKGQAIDFRVAGIGNRTLVNFVRGFDNTGVGYYPNSVFIHMDTRKRNAFWIDYSRPGEKAIYAKAGMNKQDIEKIRLARAEAKKSVKHVLKESAAPITVNETLNDTKDITSNEVAATEIGLEEIIRKKNKSGEETNAPEERSTPAKEIASVPSPGQA